MARQPTTEDLLKQGEPVIGVFAPPGADFESAGALSWTDDGGAVLELIDHREKWPNEFGELFDVHAWPRSGTPFTLLGAMVRSTATGHTSRIRCRDLGLGAHTTSNERWPKSNFRPVTLHAWMPDTGLQVPEHLDEEKRGKFRQTYEPPDRRSFAVDGATVALSPSAEWGVSHHPDWTIKTKLTFAVQSHAPLTVDEHRRRFGLPLLGFCVFASDRPDDVVRESYFDPATDRGMQVLRAGRQPASVDWGPPGDLLFAAADVPDETEAISTWMRIWEKTRPSLALYVDTIQQGLRFSGPRFLTLYTAAEGYFKMVTDGAQWKIDHLATRAGIAEQSTGATKDALGLIGATRDHYAHLSLGNKYSADDIAAQQVDSTRRLHHLMQACLLRDFGLKTPRIEELLDQHYRGWPVG